MTDPTCVYKVPTSPSPSNTAWGKVAEQAPARCYALITSAGNGSRAARADQAGAKQYQRLAGRRVIEHTLAAFLALPHWAGVAVVVAPGDEAGAAALGVQPGQVNVKAKTAEKLGPVGQGLAIECRAVALLQRL